MSSSPVLARLAIQGVVGAEVVGGRLVSCKSAPTSLTIPVGVTELASFCLSGQDGLRDVYLTNGVVKVGRACFANCPNLRRIVCRVDLKPFEAELRSGNHAKIIYREV